MTDYRSTMEHDLRRVGPPSFTFVDLTRRRDRKRRNERIVAAAVALIVAGAAIGGAFSVFRSAGRERPASVPFTVSNVSRFSLQWTSEVTGSASAAYGEVYAGSWRKLSAFELDCASGGQVCDPSWTIDVGYPTGFATPLVAGGRVFVVSRAFGHGHAAARLNAFPRSCGPGSGYPCKVLWRSVVDDQAPGTVTSQAASKDTVIVAAPGSRKLYAFSADCRPSGGRCDPAWTAPLVGGYPHVAVADGRVYVSTTGGSEGGARVYLFDEHCGAGGVSCSPLAVWDWKGDAIQGLWADDGIVYVQTGGGPGRALYAVSASCRFGPDTCPPLWVAGDVSTPSAVAVGNGMVVIGDGSNHLYAFRSDCRTDGGVCAPIWRSGPAIASGAGEAVVVAGEVVFAGSRDARRVYAFPLTCPSTCEPAWSTRASEGIMALGLTVARGELIVSSPTGISVYGPSGRAMGDAVEDTGTRWSGYATTTALVLIGLGIVLIVRRSRPRRA